MWCIVTSATDETDLHVQVLDSGMTSETAELTSNPELKLNDEQGL